MFPTASNALKHGLTGAGTALPTDMAARLEERTASFTARFQPTDDYDAYLVRQLALASIRIERCQELELAQHEHFRRQGAVMAPLDRRLAAAETYQRLAKDPAAAVARLRRTTDGCALLRDAWTALKLAAAATSCLWTDDHFARATILLGLPWPDRVGNPAAGRLFDHYADLSDPAKAPAAARALVARCDAELAALDQLSARLEAGESSEQSLRESGQWSDPPRELARLRRYELQSRRDFAAAFAQLEAREITDPSAAPVGRCASTPSAAPVGRPASTPSASPGPRSTPTSAPCPMGPIPSPAGPASRNPVRAATRGRVPSPASILDPGTPARLALDDWLVPASPRADLTFTVGRTPLAANAG